MLMEHERFPWEDALTPRRKRKITPTVFFKFLLVYNTETATSVRNLCAAHGIDMRQFFRLLNRYEAWLASSIFDKEFELAVRRKHNERKTVQ